MAGPSWSRGGREARESEVAPLPGLRQHGVFGVHLGVSGPIWPRSGVESGRVKVEGAMSSSESPRL